MKKYLFLLLILISFCVEAQHYHIRKFNTDNGLTSNEGYTLHQDKNGILWIYNGRGISAYDGISFKNFLDQKDLAPMTEVREINGRIYYACQQGIVSHNYFGFTFTPIDSSILFTYYEDRAATKRSITTIDQDGNIVVYKFRTKEDLKTDTIYSLKEKGKVEKTVINTAGKPKYRIYFITDNLNKLWVLLHYKDKDGKAKVDLSYFEKGKIIPFKNKIDYNKQTAIFISSKKEIYFYNQYLLTKLDEKKEKTLTLDYGYRGNNAGQIAEDKNGNLWMGYYQGLIKITGIKVQYIENSKRSVVKDKVPTYETGKLEYEDIYDDSNFTTRIAIDTKGNIITGNEIYDGTKFTTIDLEGREYINDELIDSEGQIWMATWKGLFCISPVPVNKLDLTGVISFVSKDGRTIITSVRRDYLNYSYFLYKDQKLADTIFIKASNDEVNTTKIIAAKKGIFLITHGEIYPIKDNKFQKTKLELPKSKTKVNRFHNDKILDDYEIRVMYPDKNGFVWGTTANNGYLFKTDGEQFWYYGKEDGLTDTIHSVYNEADHVEINYIFTSAGIFDISNGDLKPLKNSKIDISSASISIIGEKDDCLYFFCAKFGTSKKITGYRIKNGAVELMEAKNTPPANFGWAFLWYEKYENDFISLQISQCYVRSIVDKNSNKVINKPFIVNPLYAPQLPSYYFRNNKLFSFPDAGYLLIFNITDTRSDTLSDPVIIKDFINFTNSAYNDTLGFLYTTTQNKTSLSIDTKSDFLNKQIPLAHFLKLSYSSKNENFIIEDLSTKISLPFNFDPLVINYKAVCLSDGTKLRYKYKLAGLNENWTETNEDNLIYSSLPVGNYTLQIKACNNNGVWNKEAQGLIFEILPPWNRTWWAYTIYIFAGLAAFRGYLKNRTKKLEKEKGKLEATVKERTAEVVKQKHLLEEKNKEVIDSITYAKRIQQSLMPTEKYISRILGKKK